MAVTARAGGLRDFPAADLSAAEELADAEPADVEPAVTAPRTRVGDAPTFPKRDP
jgi:hypothetical protein